MKRLNVLMSKYKVRSTDGAKWNLVRTKTTTVVSVDKIFGTAHDMDEADLRTRLGSAAVLLIDDIAG